MDMIWVGLSVWLLHAYVFWQVSSQSFQLDYSATIAIPVAHAVSICGVFAEARRFPVINASVGLILYVRQHSKLHTRERGQRQILVRSRRRRHDFLALAVRSKPKSVLKASTGDFSDKDFSISIKPHCQRSYLSGFKVNSLRDTIYPSMALVSQFFGGFF